MEGIWGSEYMPEIRTGDILFIEDSLKDIATIEKSFSLLKLNGVFDKISGIILGKHELFDDMGTGDEYNYFRRGYLEIRKATIWIAFLYDIHCI